MAIPTGEKALGAELLVSMTVVTIGRIREQKAFPTPSQYVGTVTAFWFLSAFALAGPRAAKLAGSFGGLVTLALVVRHGAAAFTSIGSDGVAKVQLVDDTEPSQQVRTVRADYLSGLGSAATTTPNTQQQQGIWA